MPQRCRRLIIKVYNQNKTARLPLCRAADRKDGFMNWPKRKKSRTSLKQGMVGVILLCWALPLLLTLGIAGSFMLRNTTERAYSDLRLSAENAVTATRRRIDSAIVSSRNASYNPTIGDAWAAYKKDGNYLQMYTAISSYLTNQYRYDEKFLNTILTFVSDPDTPIYTSNTSYSVIRAYQNNVRDQVLARSPELGTGIGFLAEGGRLYMMRNMVDSNYRTYAVLVMELDSSVLFESMRNIIWCTDAAVWIDGAEADICGAPEKIAAQRPGSNPLLLQLTPENAGAVVRGSEKMGGYTFEYLLQADLETLSGQLVTIKMVLTIACLLLVPLIGAVIAFLYRKVNRPVDVLSQAAAKIETGEFGLQVAADDLGSAEFGYLGDSFNAMSDKLQNQFERIYKEELALRDARIMALQSQINPHFLNNTLEIINWEARLAGDIKVCQMLESLSTMLSAAMDRKNRPLVHLSEEMMYVDAYLYIIRERLGCRLEVKKEVDPALLDCYVPRLVLQPILENAVEHGITPTQQGTITIRAYRLGNWLRLEVENDGVTTYDDLMKIKALLSDEGPDEQLGSTSLGIRNVHQRLRILYGPESGLAISITEKGCTLCRMNLEITTDAQ